MNFPPSPNSIEDDISYEELTDTEEEPEVEIVETVVVEDVQQVCADCNKFVLPLDIHSYCTCYPPFCQKFGFVVKRTS